MFPVAKRISKGNELDIKCTKGTMNVIRIQTT